MNNLIILKNSYYTAYMGTLSLNNMLRNLFLIILGLWSASSFGEKQWYPFPVYAWDEPFVRDSSRTEVDYIPLPKAEKKWKICVSFPHIKDSFWLAVDYGVAKEAERLGVEMDLYEAGGYDNLDVQKQQIWECVAKQPDGVVIAAITTDGLNDVVTRLKAQGLPVIDLVNGMTSKDITAKSSYSHKDMGYMLGKYIAASRAREHPHRNADVAWLPGPKGSGWVDYSTEGFLLAAKESGDINILTTLYGDAGKKVQTGLVRQVLDSGTELDFIAGTAVTAEVAISLLRKHRSNRQTKLITQYFNPGVYAGIRRGKIAAGVSLSSVIQGRIAIDQIVRILENKSYIKHVGVRLKVVDFNNLKRFDRSTTLAPNGFKTIYSVN